MGQLLCNSNCPMSHLQSRKGSCFYSGPLVRNADNRRRRILGRGDESDRTSPHSCSWEWRPQSSDRHPGRYEDGQEAAFRRQGRQGWEYTSSGQIGSNLLPNQVRSISHLSMPLQSLCYCWPNQLHAGSLSADVTTWSVFLLIRILSLDDVLQTPSRWNASKHDLHCCRIVTCTHTHELPEVILHH